MQVESDIPTESTTTLKEETAREDLRGKADDQWQGCCSDPSRRRRR